VSAIRVGFWRKLQLRLDKRSMDTNVDKAIAVARQSRNRDHQQE
jgi:hypothetical protein